MLFVTVYDRLTWGHKLISRSSQHVLLSAHTLGDMFDAIPCTSNEMPERQPDGSWADAPPGGSSGAVIFLEDRAYGDGLSDKDYSECVRCCHDSVGRLVLICMFAAVNSWSAWTFCPRRNARRCKRARRCTT